MSNPIIISGHTFDACANAVRSFAARARSLDGVALVESEMSFASDLHFVHGVDEDVAVKVAAAAANAVFFGMDDGVVFEMGLAELVAV